VKILIDAFPLLAPKSGVGYYTWHLLNALAKLYASQDDFIYFYGRRFSRSIAERPPALDAVTRSTLKKIFKNPYRFTQPVKEMVFRIGSHMLKPDIYHETNYVLLPYRGTQVVTVFDLSILRYPETHPAGRVTFFNDYFQKRLPAAHHILSISEFTRQELISLMNINPGMITVAPLAPPPGFRCPAQEEIGWFKKDKHLPEKYLLYLGNLEPRKNLVMLIKAYEQFVSRAGSTAPPLVLAGEPTWLSEPLFDEVRTRNLDSRVIFPGYVAEEELPFWYAGASAFLYPSRYEGFGLPLIEAMAVGTPVLAANAASLPEVAGDAAVLLPPDDTEAWSRAMQRILDPDGEAVQLSEKGLARAELFSWEQCARITHGVYEKMVSV
jgi:alpha-1,3-rhamnosyl/mannosyltransferase